MSQCSNRLLKPCHIKKQTIFLTANKRKKQDLLYLKYYKNESNDLIQFSHNII